jgi:hypothetical protein
MSGDTQTSRDRAGGVSEPLRTWLAGPRLDWLVAALSVLMISGVALDFRSHAHGISFAEEGFVTPEHVFFYSMFLGIAAVVVAATYRNRLDGSTLVEAVPAGYEWGVVGVLMFGFGGLADFWWHGTFGFEEGVEGLTSPSHLLLATGAVLFLASPLRATWRRDEDVSGLALAPALLSASLVLAVFALFTAYVNPMINVYAADAGETARNLGIPAFLVFPTLLVGTALALARQFDLPAGALAGVFAVPALVSVTLHGTVEFVVPAVVAGIVADALVRWRSPTPADPRALRTFGLLVPVAFGVAYFVIVGATTGIAWTVHVWTGAIVLSGFAGLLLSYAVVPDAMAAGES